MRLQKVRYNGSYPTEERFVSCLLLLRSICTSRFDKRRHEKWPKIKGVHIQIETFDKNPQKAVEQCNRNSVGMSVSHLVITFLTDTWTAEIFGPPYLHIDGRRRAVIVFVNSTPSIDYLKKKKFHAPSPSHPPSHPSTTHFLSLEGC